MDLIYDMVLAIKERQSSIESMIVQTIKTVSEVHQRQIEITVPMVKEHEEVIKKHTEIVNNHRNELESLNKRIDKIPTIVGWIFGGISAGAGAILWIIEHGRSLMGGAPK
jgi:hypothetical protein